MIRVRWFALLVTFLAGQVCPARANAQATQVWTSLGPQGGILNQIFVAPSQPSTIYAAPSFGGLFRTTDGGDTWRSVSAGMCDVHVISGAVDPTDPNTIYVGTQSDGLCRSTDGGATWTSLNAGLPASLTSLPLVVAISIDPAAPTTLDAVGPGMPIIRSTNAGATWTATDSAIVAISLSRSPSNPSEMFASGVSVMSQDEIVRSTDDGQTWVPVDTTASPLVSAFPQIIVDPAAPLVAYGSGNDTVYKTIDGGLTWTPAGTGLAGRPTPALTVDPTTGNLFVVTTGTGGGLYRSTNGAASWAAVGATGLPSAFGITPYVNQLAIDPTAPATMYAVTALGVYRSTNGGATWSAANAGLNALPATGLALTGDGSVVFTTQRADPGGANIWEATAISSSLSTIPSPVTTVNAFPLKSLAVDPQSPNTIYAVTGTPNGGCGQIYKTTNGGTSWAIAENGTGIGSGACAGTVVTDPVNSGTAYLGLSATTKGGAGLYRTFDGGQNWTGVTGLPSAAVTAIAVSKLHPDIVLATSGNQVFRSADSGTTWTASSTGLPSGAGSSAGRIAIDPTNDSIAYVATSGGVFGTADGGASWTAKTNGWPSLNSQLESAVAIAVNPAAPATLYASAGAPAQLPCCLSPVISPGTGIYKSVDSGATWALVPETAGYIVTDIVVGAYRAAFAATDNGLLRLDLTTSIVIDKTAMVFGATLGGAAFVAQTPAQTVRVTEAGVGDVAWTARSNQPWLIVSPASDVGSGVLHVSVQFVPALAATQSATITIAAPAAINTLAPITVTLNALGASAAAPPFGSFDTPVDGTTGVAGSIAVTGWALDDIAVTAVRVMREPLPGEGSNLLFIGNAVQIDGARPDVAAAFPSTPRNTSAGWGYLMLSNFLPNQGNGTFTLHALADDADGHTTDLGRKTITCSNATSIKPFGAIDTPGQGDIVSGVVANFGWTLIRDPGTAPRADIPGGATVNVFVDGVAIGSPTGWTSRADLTSLFPTGFQNLNSTLALFPLDTTTLSNGIHTIAWIVNATNGQSDGIGSRFFTVSNGASFVSDVGRVFRPGVMNAGLLTAGSQEPAYVSAVIAGSQDPAYDGIVGRRGFDLSAPYRTYQSDATGTVVVQAEELDRLELLVNATSGNLRTSRGLEPLPIGSHLDPATGTFTWAPGVGFIGAYDLTFARDTASHINVRIVINPKGSNRVGPQVFIDAPTANAILPSRFLLGGWAADLDAGTGTGIGTIHVWAYPTAGGDPIFLGVADTGARPDVAALFGDQFSDSGYGLIVNSLPPGTYDLAVFAWSTAKRAFLPAKVVRVTVR